MPFDGNGNYTPASSPGYPAIPNTPILAAQFNAVVLDIASALSNCLTRDGQSPPINNVPMGNQRIINLADGFQPKDATTIGQLASSSGSNLIGDIATQTGAVVKTQKRKNQNRIEAFDFMTSAEIASVESGNLLVDVSDALNKFILAVLQSRGRGRGILNGGLYRCNFILNPITSGFLEIEGEGKNGSVLVNFASSGSLLSFNGSSLPLCALSRMGFQQNVATTGQLLEATGVFRFDIDNVFFNGAPGGSNLAAGLAAFNGTSVYGGAIDGVGFTSFGLKLSGGNDYMLTRGTIQANGVLGRPLWVENVTGGALSIEKMYFLEGANNLITNTNFGTFSGCYFDSAQGAVSVSGCEDLFFVAGCEFANRVTTGTGNGSGIIFGNSKSCQVANSYLINNGLDGVIIGADTVGITIVNNVIDGNNVTNTAGVVAGVNVAGGAQAFKIKNNTIGNNTLLFTGHQKYGVAVNTGASDNYEITGNDVRNNDTAGIVDNGTGTNAVVKDNLGYKLGVAVIAPPSSTSIYRAGHCPETVYLRGGTITEVKIPDNAGSVLFTSTPCTIQLEPNETMSITYSAAPTMTIQRH